MSKSNQEKTSNKVLLGIITGSVLGIFATSLYFNNSSSSGTLTFNTGSESECVSTGQSLSGKNTKWDSDSQICSVYFK